jgi:hypothetical protein
MVEGRKPWHFSQAFSNRNQWDLGVEVGMLRMRGMWLEVEPIWEVRVEFGNASVKALLISA